MSNKKHKNNRNNKLLDKKLALQPDNNVDEVDAYQHFLQGLFYEPSDIPKVNPKPYSNIVEEQ